MSYPNRPAMRPLTNDEKAERRRKAEREAAEQQLHHQVDREHTSPYDAIGEALSTAVGDALFAALNSPAFTEELRARGYAIVPAADEAPEAPLEWTHTAIDLLNTSSPYVLETVHSLWCQAWRAGREAAGTEVSR